MWVLLTKRVTKLELKEHIDRFKENEPKVDTFVNGDENTDVIPSGGGAPYPTQAKAVAKLINSGGIIGAANLTALQAITPTYTNQLGLDESNGKIYHWDGAAWIDTGRNYISDLTTYVNNNAMFKPTVNAVVNLNDAPYGINYTSVSGNATLANNYPVSGGIGFSTTTAATGTQVKTQRYVMPFVSPIRVFDRSYTRAWSAWSEGTNKQAVDALSSLITGNTSALSSLTNRVFPIIGKNKFNKATIVNGSQYSPTNKNIVSTSAYRRSDFIKVVEEETYTLSGNQSSLVHIAWFATNDPSTLAISNTTARTGVAPTGANYAVFNITSTSSTDTTYDNTVQFEIGASSSTYEPYKTYMDILNIYDSQNIALNDFIFNETSFNKIDPSKIDFTRRYSTGFKSFVTDSLLIAASDYIPVIEGEWYTLSGSAKYGETSGGGQGGYFANYGDNIAIDNIAFVAPVSGSGHAFKVPTGLGITHVVVSLKKTSGNVLDGVAQLEVGELPTVYQPYELKKLIKPELLPNSTTPTATLNDAAWFEYTNGDGVRSFPDKLPNFRQNMLMKTRDEIVVMTGTSLTARTSEHSTLRSDAAFRPPMMHSNAFCSIVWDSLKWDGQQYRRYDSAYFAETGTFNTSSNLTEWGDGAYRDGLTRYSASSNASVQFEIPISAWQFNFIYRADSVGCTAKVSVADGNGLVQVYDENASMWVEANNFTFTMIEPTPVTRSVAIPSPVTGTTTPTTLASKGNTTYQKRLKMRCRNDDGSFNSLSTAKSITVSNDSGTGRFMYWGVEWSHRQYMISFINSSRGSHNTSATSASGLPRYQDNEVWGFKPTLIFSELAIHNDGAAAAGVYPVGQWEGLAYNYVNNLTYELSMYSRSNFFGLSPEYAFFMGSTTWNFNGINEDGTLKASLQSSSNKGSARSMTSLDKYQEAVTYLLSQDIVCLDTSKRWIDAGYAIFGSMKDATVGSGKAGATFTNDGSHWNDTGAKIMAKMALTLFK